MGTLEKLNSAGLNMFKLAQCCYFGHLNSFPIFIGRELFRPKKPGDFINFQGCGWTGGAAKVFGGCCWDGMGFEGRES